MSIFESTGSLVATLVVVVSGSFNTDSSALAVVNGVSDSAILPERLLLMSSD